MVKTRGRHNAQLLSSLLDELPFGVAALDFDSSSKQFRYTYANPLYERLSSGSELLGLTPAEAWADKAPDADELQRVYDTGDERWEQYISHHEASAPEAESILHRRLLTRISHQGRHLVLDIVSDVDAPFIATITEAAEPLSGPNVPERVALIARIASMASSSLTLQRVCERTLSGLCEQIRELTSGGIYVLRDDGSLQALALYRRGQPIEVPDEHEHSTLSPNATTLVQQGYQLFTHENGRRAAKQTRPDGSPDSRWIDLAIERRGTMLGVLELGFEGNGTFDQDEIRLYHAIAAVLGNAVGNARSYEGEARNARIAEGVGIVLGASMRASTERELGRECLEVLASLTDSELGFMGTTEADGTIREVALHATAIDQGEGGSGMTAEMARIWPFVGLAEEAVKAGETVIANDPEPYLDGMPEGHPLLTAVMATPLIGKRGQVFGILAFANRPRGYGQAERQTVEALAPAIVEAVERFRAERELAENARFADELNHIESIIHASLDANTIAEEALRTGLEALGADSASLALHEPPNFRATHAIGFEREIVGHLIPEDLEPHSTLAISTKAPVLVEDTATDERVQFAHMLAYDIHAVMVLPLLVGGKAFGNVYYNFKQPRHFSRAEVHFALRLSLSLSLAMENARLYETERTISNRLQEALLSLPDSVPGVDFAHAYYPATDAAKVGGDFYDIFELSYGLVGITIGDVAGKGIDAAALTSLVKNTIRAHASERGKTPAQILRLTNEVLYKTTPVESFVTVFFGLLDCRDGRLVAANGGHTTAAVVRADGDVVKLPVTGPLLGALPEIELEHIETSLDPEDTLFLYTDGLTEARRGGELYGEDRLFAALSEAPERRPRKLMQRVVADMMTYSRGVLRDDLALLAVRRSESGPVHPHQEKLRV